MNKTHNLADFRRSHNSKNGFAARTRCQRSNLPNNNMLQIVKQIFWIVVYKKSPILLSRRGLDLFTHIVNTTYVCISMRKNNHFTE